MVDDFQMVISTEDMLKVLNVGIQQLNPFGKFITGDDRVSVIQYSRDTKRYTLVFESGRKIKVVEQPKPAPQSMERSGSLGSV